MNVQQMHLAVQQGVDKINSLQADVLLPQEIDIELNKSLIKFISTRYGKNNIYQKGFEQSQKRIDDLRSLVTEFSGITTYKEQLNNNTWVDTFSLPSDYMYLVAQRSKVITNNNCTKITFTPQTVNDGDLNEYFNPYFTIGLSEFVCNDNTEIAHALVLMEEVYNGALGVSTIWVNPGLTFPQDLPQLINSILDDTNWPPGIKIYWEQLNVLHHPGHFIVTVNTDVLPWFEWDASVGTVSTLTAINFSGDVLQSATGINSPLTYDTRRVPNDLNNVIYNTVGNTFVQHDDILTLLGDPFNTTKRTDPLTTIRGNNIDVYTNDIFIIDEVKITYIRNPKKISLSLGIDCELPEHTHQTVVDMTVSSILEGISDPRYKSYQNEVGKNE